MTGSRNLNALPVVCQNQVGLQVQTPILIAAIINTLISPPLEIFMMKMSDVEATGSGGNRAEDSEARPQVAGNGRAADLGARAGLSRIF